VIGSGKERKTGRRGGRESQPLVKKEFGKFKGDKRNRGTKKAEKGNGDASWRVGCTKKELS